MEGIPDKKVLQGRYEVVRQLGRGGMGAVYLATDLRFGSTVALKQTLVSGEQLQKAFEREARLLNTLQHASMPHVIDYFFEGEGQFLVMQFIPGEDLGHMLRSRGRAFDVPVVLLWLDELLDLLDYLHTHEPPIIHRDIKPENLKVTQRGKIILLDFGLAKGLAEQGAATLSTASVVGYTPAYAALEQIRGLGTDARSDIYSLAATAYHLLTGLLPADALQRAEAFVNGAQDPLRPVELLNSEVPGRVASVLHNAMALRRDDRPASARDLRMSLRESGGDLITGALGTAAPLGIGGMTGSTGGWTTNPRDAQTRPETSPVPVTEAGQTMPFDPRQGATVAVANSGGYVNSGGHANSAGYANASPTWNATPSVPQTVPGPQPSKAAGGGHGLALGIVGGLLFVAIFVAGIVGVLGWQQGWFSRTQPPPAPVIVEQPSTPPIGFGDPSVIPGTSGGFTPMPAPTGPVDISLTAIASSERDPIGANRYTADMAVDGRRDTSWVEGGEGEGIGESIEVTMSAPAKLRYIKVCPGFFKSGTVWAKNNRVESATITLSDGREISASFADVDTEQVVEVGGGPISGFTISIDSVYYGGDDLDTCISEITVEVQ